MWEPRLIIMLENLVNEFNSKSLYLNRSSFFPQILFLKLIETFFKERVIFPQELLITRNFPEVSLSNSYWGGHILNGEGGREELYSSIQQRFRSKPWCFIIITDGGAGYKQPKILLVTLPSSLSRWSCCYQFLITWRKNENCDQRYLTKTVKTGTYWV